MAAALAYVGAIMFLMARPVVQYIFWRLFALDYESILVFAVPITGAVILSFALSVLPLIAAEKRLAAGDPNIDWDRVSVALQRALIRIQVARKYRGVPANSR